MRTVILDVRSPEESIQGFVDVWKTGRAKKEARISFATPELLWKVLTAKRWELLKALSGAGPVTIREAAKKVNRDVKAVHNDLTALRKAGVIDSTDTGQVEFPYANVMVELTLKAAA